MLQDVVDRGTGTAGARGRLPRPRRGEDGDHQRRHRRLVRGLHAGAGGAGLVRARPAARPSCAGRRAGRSRRRCGGASCRASSGRGGDFAMPRGVVTETVDRATGYVVDPGCPPQGADVHRVLRPRAPAAPVLLRRAAVPRDGVRHRVRGRGAGRLRVRLRELRPRHRGDGRPAQQGDRLAGAGGPPPPRRHASPARCREA